MRVLFDEGTPDPLRHALLEHIVETARERDWSGLRNGDLMAAAEAAGFDVFVTTDQQIKYQQSLSMRRFAVVVLLTTSWPRIRGSLAAVVAA